MQDFVKNYLGQKDFFSNYKFITIPFIAKSTKLEEVSLAFYDMCIIDQRNITDEKVYG